MKPRMGNKLPQQSLLLLGTVLLMSFAGRLAGSVSDAHLCEGWPLCMPASQAAWFKTAHIVLAIVGGALILGLLVRAWNAYRADSVLLPLITVTAVLFAGQAFLGAILVARDYRLDLVVLHAATSVSLWIALAVLAAVSISHRRPTALSIADVGPRRWTDFITLSKPWIVGLLLVTTFGGLVAGGQELPPLDLAIWTLLGGTLAAAGSSALN